MKDQAQTVTQDSVVSYHYTLFDQAGEQVETTRDGGPNLCLMGANNVLLGLEQALLGKNKGESFKVTLEAPMAYGQRKPDHRDRVPAKYLKHEGKLRPGQIVRVDTDKGLRTVTIIKVGKFNVDVDLNHPLAGQSITFDVEITDLREASADERAHGHAHGVGGHQH